MVELIVIAAAAWIVVACGAGLGLGRVISRADRNSEMSDLVREFRVSH